MKKDLLRKVFISSSTFLITLVIFGGIYCFGQAPSDPLISNPLKVDNVVDFISLVLSEIVRVGAILCVLALVYVGYLFVEARGNQEKISSAKKALWGTIIGIALLLGAQVIASIIKGTTDALTN